MHRPLIAAAIGIIMCVATQPSRAARPTTAPARLSTIREAMPGCPVPLELIRIPAGRVKMPTTRPGLKTEIVEVRSVWISRTEITWDMYNLFLQGPLYATTRPRISPPTAPYASPDYNFRASGYPAAGMTSHAASRFCEWLSEETGYKYRLPTEAEWEYACRAGGDGDITDVDELKRVAWFEENSARADEELVTHPVGTKQPNAWGLHDMLGNAAEWVSGYDGQPVLKGGSFTDSAKDVTSRARAPYRNDWSLRDPQLPKNWWWLSDGPFAGFRIVRED